MICKIFNKNFCHLIERNNYEMLKSVYLTDIIPFFHATIVYSNWIHHPWYNHIYIHQNEYQYVKNIDEIISFSNTYFNIKKQEYCIYIPDESENMRLHLENRNFYSFETENWWYYNTHFDFVKHNTSSFTINKISANNFKDFEKIFKIVFSVLNIEDFIKCSQNAFIEHASPTRMGLIAYKNNIPVGILCIIINQNFCGLYSAATIPTYRNQGIFTSLFDYVIQYCKINKINHILLQAVSTDECNKIYHKMGFINIFSRIGFLKKHTNNLLSV